MSSEKEVRIGWTKRKDMYADEVEATENELAKFKRKPQQELKWMGVVQ
ncbi:hypothetical protein [Saccharibacillus sacchari]|uniref:Uncharacterized protein n=1 Tax=Saccharibacillus sacchari TaxID=456493 RepID=A0ACC6PAL5_9BACL